MLKPVQPCREQAVLTQCPYFWFHKDSCRKFCCGPFLAKLIPEVLEAFSFFVHGFNRAFHQPKLDVNGVQLYVWLSPYHWYGKRHTLSFTLQPLGQTCVAHIVALVRSPRFILVTNSTLKVMLAGQSNLLGEIPPLSAWRKLSTDVTESSRLIHTTSSATLRVSHT